MEFGWEEEELGVVHDEEGDERGWGEERVALPVPM